MSNQRFYSWVFVSLLLNSLVAWVLIQYVDRPVFEHLYQLNPGIKSLAGNISRLGLSGYAITLFVLVGVHACCWAKKYQRANWCLFGLLALGMNGLINIIIKFVFGRARPPMLLERDIYAFTWFSTESRFMSFPSGHTITLMTVATVLCLAYRGFWVRLLIMTLAGAIAFCRVLTEAHYVSDIWFASYLAIAITMVFYRLTKQYNLWQRAADWQIVFNAKVSSKWKSSKD